MGIFVPIYKNDGSVILFAPLSTAELKRKFSLTAEYARLKCEAKEKIGSFSETVDLGATKEFTCHVRFSGVVNSKQKEGYLVGVKVIRKTDKEEKIMAENFFTPDHKIEYNAMEFYNEAFGYEDGTKEQMQFFAELAEANVKFKTVIDFIFGHDLPMYFDLENLSYDMAFGKKPKAFNYLVNYGVDPNNQFSDIDYLMVTLVKGKYVVARKKIDLRINDSLEEHYTFTSFEKFSKFLLDL